jgi:hypothetical protein
MSPLLKNIIALIVGIIVGSIVNMGIILISGYIIPLPEGVDATDPESLKAGMSLFEFKHFIFPFLAHALGTLAGALVAVRLAVNHTVTLAVIITAFFMIGGIYSAWQIQGPNWFTVIDLSFAYMPMGLLGWAYGRKKGVPALGKK